MADTITLSPQGLVVLAAVTPLVLTPLPGSLQTNDGNDDRGGGDVPQARAAAGKAGQFRVVIDSAGPTEAELVAILEACCKNVAGQASPVGTGATNVEGAGDYLDIDIEDALIDMTFEGESVQIATISYKGNQAA